MATEGDLLLVRAGFETDLVAELADAGRTATVRGEGLVLAAGELPRPPLIFERQRLPRAGWIPEAQLRPVTDDVLGAITAPLRGCDGPWLAHVYASAPELHDRAAGFARALFRLIKRHLPDVAARHTNDAGGADVPVLQLCRVPDGLWYSAAPRSALSSPWIGGIPRLRDDPRAPSRSYLKLEEAFARMNEWPAPRQTAVDLGAAPGGWTLALAQRGCAVTAVDNGPLRLPAPAPGWGRIQYLHANGITFEPQRPVDWLVADMLVAPGVALGLLRRWIGERWMRRFVVNVKIPQADAYVVLRPVIGFLQSRGRALRFEVRQLYHDRREVTAMGRLD